MKQFSLGLTSRFKWALHDDYYWSSAEWCKWMNLQSFDCMCEIWGFPLYEIVEIIQYLIFPRSSHNQVSHIFPDFFFFCVLVSEYQNKVIWAFFCVWCIETIFFIGIDFSLETNLWRYVSPQNIHSACSAKPSTQSQFQSKGKVLGTAEVLDFLKSRILTH